MSYSGRMQNSHYYSVFFAPRGRDRIYDLGMHIAQMYLSPVSYTHLTLPTN